MNSDLTDLSSLVSTILHWAVVMVISTETWVECETEELRVWWRVVEQKHAPADRTWPLIVRCRLRAGFLGSGLQVQG